MIEFAIRALLKLKLKYPLSTYSFKSLQTDLSVDNTQYKFNLFYRQDVSDLNS